MWCQYYICAQPTGDAREPLAHKELLFEVPSLRVIVVFSMSLVMDACWPRSRQLPRVRITMKPTFRRTKRKLWHATPRRANTPPAQDPTRSSTQSALGARARQRPKAKDGTTVRRRERRNAFARPTAVAPKGAHGHNELRRMTPNGVGRPPARTMAGLKIRHFRLEELKM